MKEANFLNYLQITTVVNKLNIKELEEWFRNLDKLKCKECENCKDWKYCRGDSLYTWDFNNNRPKLCLNKILEGDGENE